MIGEYERYLLSAEFGETEVERALIFIAEATNPRGLRIRVKPTPEMVRDLLESVHGRLGLNEVKLSNERGFYHHPDWVAREWAER